MSKLTKELLEQLLAAEKAATQGWRAGRPDMQSYTGGDGIPYKALYNDIVEKELAENDVELGEAGRIYGNNSIADSQFFVLARNNMRALIDEVNRLNSLPAVMSGEMHLILTQTQSQLGSMTLRAEELAQENHKLRAQNSWYSKTEQENENLRQELIRINSGTNDADAQKFCVFPVEVTDGWQDEIHKLRALLETAKFALTVGAFHWKGCPWFEQKECGCAHMEVEKALKQIEDSGVGK